MNIELDFKMEVKNNMDCLDAITYSLATWLGEDYKMQYLECWGFKYDTDRKNTLISDKIGSGRGNEFEHLSKYHGVDIIECVDKSSIEELMIRELKEKGKPLLLQVDTFWAKWMEDFYQKKHFPTHFVLATGYNEDKGLIKVMDKQEAISGYWASLEDIQNAIVYAFKIQHNRVKADFDAKEALLSMLKRLRPQKYLNSNEDDIIFKIDSFIYDLKENFDFYKEIGCHIDNMAGSRIITALKDIGQNRYKASLALKFIKENSGMEELQGLINRVVNLSTMWNQILGSFLKSCYLKENDKMIKKIVKNLSDLREREKEAIEFLELCYNGEIQSSQIELAPGKLGVMYDNSVNYEFNYVNIEQYYNNTGCYCEISIDEIAELSKPERYLMSDGYVGIHFRNINIPQSHKDNIVCEGQRLDLEISISEDNYLMLLMCSEYTRYEEEIELIYNNGKHERVKIGVTSWLYPEPSFNDFIALKGIPVHIDRTNSPSASCYKFNGHLFGSMYKINEENCVLKCIVLPDCANIHIFGITIASKKRDLL